MVRWLLALALAGCIVDQDAYRDALEALADEDGDGVPLAGGDCDDEDATRYPGAAESWYDGADQDCAGDDDNDADGDGDASEDHGGADCNDEDPNVHTDADEGWSDLGTDNDCDGSLDEQVVIELGSIGTTVNGPTDDVGLGYALLVLDEVGPDAEPLVVASGPFYGDDHGLGVAWPARDLFEGADLDSATWTITGEDALSVLGIALGSAGEVDDPQVWVSASGIADGAGQLLGFQATDLLEGTTEPTWRVDGTSEGDYFGYEIIRGHDQDGDGIADLVVGSALDSRYAELGGVVRVFLDPVARGADWTDEDADLIFTTDLLGAFLRVNSPGDFDGDGLDDLSFCREVESWDQGAGLVVTDHSLSGIEDVSSVASLTIFGQVWAIEDTDSDARGELFATAGALYRYELPLEGTSVTPWDHADAELSFSGDGDYVVWAEGRAVGMVDGVRLAVSATTWPDGEGRGAVFFPQVRWEGSAVLDDVELIMTGEAAGDAAGAAVERVPDIDGDTWDEWIIGAPGTDTNGSASGRVYAMWGPS